MQPKPCHVCTSQGETTIGQLARFPRAALDADGISIDHDALHHTFTTLSGVGDVPCEEAGNIFVREGGLWAQINGVLLDVPTAQIRSCLVTAAKLMAPRM